MALYAVVENGIVTNIVTWDGATPWSPVSGEAILVEDSAGIGWTYSGGKFINPNPVISPTNQELLKAALAELSVIYQQDIEVLNRAWLAAAVSDGINENIKKNAVLAQITARKTQYSTDRAAVIAKYPV